MKSRIITKNMQPIQGNSSSKNRFYGLQSSQRQPAIVGVKILNDLINIYVIYFYLENKF